MQKGDIEPGQVYAVREVGGAEFQQVRVIEHVRRDKWRVEWLSPNAGLIDFVKSSTIVCHWDERRAVLRDERRAAELRREAERSWPGDEHPLVEAAGVVLAATGEMVDVFHGELQGPPDALDRVAGRANFDWPSGTSAYTDRYGTRHIPWPTVLELVQRFAVAEPRSVLQRIDIQERRYEVEAAEAGRAYLLPILEKYRAGWALVRQWAGFDQDRRRLGEEIKRLRQVIDRAVWDLRRSDVDPARVAARLERGMKGE